MKKLAYLAVAIVATVALAIGLCSCNSTTKIGTKRVTIVRGDATVATLDTCMLAVTPAQWTRGLMFADKLDDGEGMLFIFNTVDTRSFWMKNTKIPLSIAFISADFRIAEIRDMVPYSLDLTTPAMPYLWALEVPQGWFNRACVVVGDSINIGGI